jgi:SAM-dependent methyltransferase
VNGQVKKVSDTNFIKEIHIGENRSANKHVLRIAHPHSQVDRYCITVICGKNNTGKTHILKQLSEAFHVDRKFHNEIEKESVNVHAVFTRPGDALPILLYFDSTTFAKSRFNVIPIGEYKHDPTGKKPLYRNAAIRFMGQQMQHIVAETYDSDSWVKDAAFRLHLVRENIDLDAIYLCDRNNDVVKRFEDAVGGRLYFRYFKQAKNSEFLELVLRYDEYRIFRYPDWSDGQKTLFAALSVIDYHRPNILLIDEIENHFHPEYITQLISFIKEVVPQTILATHHPHMLFSRLVDRVYYIQLENREQEPPPSIEKFHKSFHPRSHRRRIGELTSDFDLITAAYGLFHNQDRQLLYLAEKLHHAVDLRLTQTLVQLFRGEAIDSRSGLFTDTQTGQLLSVIKDSLNQAKGAVEILDYGAGRGRTLLEALKESQDKRGFTFRWSFWEKELALRSELESLSAGSSEDNSIQVITNIENIPAETFDIAVLSNILHEVTPKEFARILSTIRRVIKSDSGKLVILELFPLIHPEKYAVPYSKERMEAILHQTGWKVDSGFFPVKNGLIQAYWVCAHSPDSSKSPDQHYIQKVIEETWEEILKHSCLLYNGKYQITTADDQIRIMDNLTTIASILNYKFGYWI